ncbi:uncharacterized protein LOC130802315 isoform X2 [Amaranthus tricolor]|uniref:uncharacterized protein LOC130802315 isoform X2 n=1 Tax=Amaranthus tricolor TaxID=29722 RepID=UPI002586F869|nr:uncharacterized protein LOC130802315 isoform X2 [Amaranthus tricolor]
MEGAQQHKAEQEFNLKEWHLRARISRDNPSSRRYSASYIRSFREESRTSFKSNFTISSTASSPGYHIKDEIDPSTYSFTKALKALQAKSGYVWECVSPEGFALNSKWDEAERYICNPLSGEVPMECLSSKTLNGRSFRSYMASRVTMSAPLVYSMHHRKTSTTSNYPSINSMSPHVTLLKEQLVKLPSLEQEKKMVEIKTRDVGTQSSLITEDSSSSPSPTSTPSIKERKTMFCEETEDGDTQNSSSSINNIKLNPKEECTMQVEVKITREEEETKRRIKENGNNKKKIGQFCICRQNNGCLQLSWSSFGINNKKREKKNLKSKN